ncbi:MAG: HEPN domain-containing protein [Egibacteraceae bacterium]
MLDEAEYQRWRESAADAAEQAAAQRHGASYHWACFLAEQAAQFALKALLHGIGRPAWGHDLPELGQRFTAALDEELAPPVHEALLRLSRYYIASRYPDAHPSGTAKGHYSGSDADQAIADTALVFALLDGRWRELQAADHDGS